MRELTYLDFDVLVERTGDGEYLARVVEAPAGQTAPVAFNVPFSELEVDNFLLRIGRPRRGPVRGETSVEAAAVREFGGRLFDAVFHDEVRVALATSLDQAETRDAGLRVRLRLSDCPELVDLPWEYLYDRDTRRFLALSEWTPVVRYLQFPGRVRPLAVRPPLRVLVLVASSSDFPVLDVDGEWEKLRVALADLEGAGRVQVERVPTGTLADLQRQLRRSDYHVFHYIGHGGYDAHAEDGVLILEGPTGRGQPVSGQDLGVLLHDHRTLRLAVLNSCEGARGGRTDPYSGTAQSLVRQGIPAVVAMQFEITDDAAITLSQSLYEAVADGYPLDAAMAEARKAVRHQPNPVEWGTPVLYLRAPDGRIFELPPEETRPRDDAVAAGAGTRAPPAPGEAAELSGDPDYLAALAAFFTERWDTAVELLNRVSARHPDHPQVTQRLDHARRNQQVAKWDAAARSAAEEGRWPAAVAALEHLAETRPDDDGVATRLETARREQQRADLHADIRRLHEAHQWAAVVAAGEHLAELDPEAADPDGLVTNAHALLVEAALADRYTAGLLHLDQADLAAAEEIFAAIEAEQPGYRDTTALLARARTEGSTDVGPRQDRLPIAVGLITLGSAVLVAVGAVLAYRAEGSLHFLWQGLDPWYVVGLLLLVVIAGGLSVSGGIRAVVGRCLVVVAAALSVFGAAFLFGKIMLNARGPPFWQRPLGGGWLELAGHLALLVAAALAVRSLVRDPGARPVIGRIRGMVGTGRRRPLAVGLAAFLIAGIGAGGWIAVDVPRFELGDIVGAIAISPDGERLYAVVALPEHPESEASDYDFKLVAVDTAADSAIRTVTIGPTESLGVSPDGLLLYAAGDSGLSVIDAGTLGAIGSPVSVPGTGRRLVVSPDGDRVYVTSGEDSIVSVFDTSTIARLDFQIDLGGEAIGMAIAPDGERVYVATEAGVAVVSAETGEVGEPMDVHGTGAVAVSPDGDTLFVTGYDDDPESATYLASYVAIVDIATGDIEAEIPVSGSSLNRIVVSPSGRRLYVHGYFTGVVAIDPVAQATIGDPIHFIAASMAISPDGSRLYLGGGDSDIWVIDTATNEVIGDAIMVGD